MSKVEFEVVVASGRGGSISNRLLKSEEWISEPYCRYPQVIIVRLKATQVTRIELLIHRKFIPSRFVPFTFSEPLLLTYIRIIQDGFVCCQFSI